MHQRVHRFSPDRPPGVPEPVPPPGNRGSAGRDLHATPILVVEDESMIAWMIVNVLEEAGFDSVAVAATGAQALDEARAHAPGLLVTDVNLGAGADGVETALTICAARPAPVIFVTGYADDSMRQRIADTLPRAQILRKPVDPVLLIRAVLRALAN